MVATDIKQRIKAGLQGGGLKGEGGGGDKTNQIEGMESRGG